MAIDGVGILDAQTDSMSAAPADSKRRRAKARMRHLCRKRAVYLQSRAGSSVCAGPAAVSACCGDGGGGWGSAEGSIHVACGCAAAVASAVPVTPAATSNDNESPRSPRSLSAGRRRLSSGSLTRNRLSTAGSESAVSTCRPPDRRRTRTGARSPAPIFPDTAAAAAAATAAASADKERTRHVGVEDTTAVTVTEAIAAVTTAAAGTDATSCSREGGGCANSGGGDKRRSCGSTFGAQETTSLSSSPAELDVESRYLGARDGGCGKDAIIALGHGDVGCSVVVAPVHGVTGCATDDVGPDVHRPEVEKEQKEAEKGSDMVGNEKQERQKQLERHHQDRQEQQEQQQQQQQNEQKLPPQQQQQQQQQQQYYQQQQRPSQHQSGGQR
eukprot:TRINITY_DN14371_c0_g5_i2.p1 TRINITY_DN14371_c0_g5~~TRINITY_DN14371_c0_g5_i2.p1  ORF type:complete len:420 (+),score=108.10 TRINITY_DN14371_c0_g5_i2:106-1260(+)